MGLDMNLYRKTYVKNWEHMKPEERTKVTVSGKKAKLIKAERISEITEELASWRKANQIHNWFVQNCNDGDDNNGSMYVSGSQLKELLNVVNQVLAASKLVKGQIKNGERLGKSGEWEPIMEDGEYIEDPTLAQELLPTTSGFFFGSTEYDQWYYRDLEYTKQVLEEVLAEDPEGYGDYEYVASW